MNRRVIRTILAITLVPILNACEGSRTTTAALASPVQPTPTTVLVKGHVHDTLGIAVAEARIEVLDGPQTGASTTTGADGTFTLTAILAFGSRLRATKDGYESALVPFQNVASITFYLSAIGTVNLAGPYTLTVDADPACVDLPAAARKRTYEATITRGPAGSWAPYSVAMLQGPGLDSYFHSVALRISGDRVALDLSDNGIVEEIADEAYFSIGGYGIAQSATESNVSAAFPGTIDYCEVKPGPLSFWPCSGPVVALQQCQSSNHRLTLTRR